MPASLRLGATSVLAVLALAGCGGGDDKTKGFEGPKLGSQSGLVRGYGADATSAGSDESYVPSGRIVADSDFRPWDDGFAFENYGNDVGPQNMTAAQVEDLFGAQVCLTGTGETCELVPPAKQWMENENAAMAGGHCMGFSVTALRIFEKSLNASTFGADKAPDLEIRGNLPLQETIAENWVYQDLPLVKKATVSGTPNALLDKLKQSLNDGSESYTLGIFNKTGGHAITPFAVEDKGSGKVNVLVYDNNFPGIVRAVAFDTNADAWIYHGGPNPKQLGEVYEGDADNQAMVLLPTSPGVRQQPCPFCDGSAAQPRGYSTGSTLSKSEQYDEISLAGDPVNHAHLLLTDEKGNHTGFLNGKIVNEIPGAEVDRSLTIQNWREAPEPSYRVPVGSFVRVTVDGTGLDKKANHDLTLIGPGEYFELSDLKLEPGQKDFVTFEAGGGGLNYETNAKIGSAPLIGGGLVRGEGDNLEAYYFIASPVGIEGASSMAFILDQEDGLFGIDTAGTSGDLAGTGVATYVMTMTRATVDGRTSTWSSPDSGLFLKGGDKGQVAVVNFTKKWDRNKPIPVIVKSPGGKEGLQLLKPTN